jgi:hypothetical protein
LLIKPIDFRVEDLGNPGILFSVLLWANADDPATGG